MPETGERFEGLLRPVVTGPAFAIREAAAIFTLDDYIYRGTDRANIPVAGGTPIHANHPNGDIA